MERFRRSHRGYTLLEMIVIMAIVALLALIAVPVMSSVLGKSKSRADEVSLVSYARSVQALTASHSGVMTYQFTQFTQAAADIRVAVSAATPTGTWTTVQSQNTQLAASSGYGLVSVDVSLGTVAGLAMIGQGGQDCSMARIEGNNVQSWNSTANIGTNCSGTVATAGPGGSPPPSAGTPAHPAGVTAVAGDTQVAVSWNAVAGATGGYHLFRDDVEIWAGTANTFTDTGLTNGTSYRYKVTASTSGGATSDPSADVTAVPVTTPATPTGLTATGGPASADLSWTAVTSTAAAPVTGYRIYQGGVQVWSGAATAATILDLTGGTAYTFTVAAYGPGGASAQCAAQSATPFVAPATPTGFTVTAGDTQAILGWAAVASVPGAPMTGYEVLRDGASVWSGATNTWTNTGLTNGTTYAYTVRTVGPGGNSAQSAPVAATPITAPATPTGLVATAGDGQVTLTWTAAVSTAAAPVTGYRVYQDGVQVWTGAGTSTTITGLTNGTTYSFTVAAYGAGGASAQTAPVATTPIAVPATPAGLTATAGDTQVVVSWTAVGNTAAAPVSGYEVFRDGVSVWSGATNTWTNTGLTNGTTYAYTVRTLGPGGNSPASAPASATPVTAPATPAGLATTPGNTQVALSWTAVGTTAAAPVSGYRVYQDEVQVWTGAATSATVTGLTNGTSYSFTVAAYGPGGASAQSATVSATPITAPATPTGLTATAGDTQVVVSWTTVTTTAASPVSGYEIFRDGVSVQTLNGVATNTWTNTGLTNGTSYSFTIRTLGTAGNSAQSSAVVIAPAQAPASPSGLTSVPSDGQATVTWDAVTSTSVAPVSGYRVYQSGVQIWQGTGTTLPITPLTNGTTYNNFTVATYGPGGVSAQVAFPAVTPIAIPAAPTGLTGSGGDHAVALSWNTVTSTSAAPVSGYKVYQNGTQVWSGTGTSTTVTGLTNGTSYNFTVATDGPSGTSAPSSAVPVTPVAVPPSSPTGLALTPQDGQVMVNWNAVTGTLSAPVSGYRIYQDGVQVWAGAGTSTTITGLTNGTSYSFTVTAYGNGGESAQSTSQATYPRSVPGVPSNVSATPGNTQITVNWTASTKNAGDATDQYRVTYNGSTVTVGSGTLSTNLTGLTNGTGYTITVAAHNANGWSVESTSVATVPYPSASTVRAPGDVGTNASAKTTDGGVIVVGSYHNTVTFGASNITAVGLYDVFIAKLSSVGTWSWVKSLGSAGDDKGTVVAVDASNNIFVGGTYSNSATISGTTLPAASGADGFLLKLDSNGTVLTTATVSSAGLDEVRGLGVDSSGNAYILANSDGNPTIGGTTFTNFGSGADLIVAKFTTANTWGWVKQAGSAYAEFAAGLAMTSTGPVIAGGFRGTAAFGATNLTDSSTTLPDVFIARLDTSGTWLAATSQAGTGSDYATAITANSTGDVWIVMLNDANVPNLGISVSKMAPNVVKIDSSNTWIWAAKTTMSCNSPALRTKLALDAVGNVYFTDTACGTTTIGSNNWNPKNNTVNYVIYGKVGPSGTWLWSNDAYGNTSTQPDSAGGAVIDNSGRVWYGANVDSPGTIGSVSWASGMSGVFIPVNEVTGAFP